MSVRLSYYASVLALLTGSQLLTGCFSAYSRWWGNEPSTGVKITAAAADVVTSPVQLPVYALHKLNQAPYDPQAARARAEEEKREREGRIATSKIVFEELKSNPALLTDDNFWSRQPANDYGLLWFLQEPTAPHSPAINAYLLKRFPDKAAAILSNGRTTQSELTTIAADRLQTHRIRECAIDTLLRDKTFDFREPWRRMVLDEFQLKITLLFGTQRYTRAELVTLSHDPKTPAWIRQMARDNISRNTFKPEPIAQEQRP